MELRITASINNLLQRKLLALMPIEQREGKQVCSLMPGQQATNLCAEIFNFLVDVQTIAFSTHWVPHITPDDIHQQQLMDWSDPANPQNLGFLAGIDGEHKFVLGRQDGFDPVDPGRLDRVLENLPLKLWEELIQTSLRDLAVGRFRSALMQACLGVENFFRAVLATNIGHGDRFQEQSLKVLAIKKGSLPSLLGFRLDSAESPWAIRNGYLRLTALRDSIMHTGEMRYSWPPGAQRCQHVDSPAQVRIHVGLALMLIHRLNCLLVDAGKNGVNRGLIPCYSELLTEQEIEAMRVNSEEEVKSK